MSHDSLFALPFTVLETVLLVREFICLGTGWVKFKRAKPNDSGDLVDRHRGTHPKVMRRFMGTDAAHWNELVALMAWEMACYSEGNVDISTLHDLPSTSGSPTEVIL